MGLVARVHALQGLRDQLFGGFGLDAVQIHAHFVLQNCPRCFQLFLLLLVQALVAMQIVQLPHFSVALKCILLADVGENVPGSGQLRIGQSGASQALVQKQHHGTLCLCKTPAQWLQARAVQRAKGIGQALQLLGLELQLFQLGQLAVKALLLGREFAPCRLDPHGRRLRARAAGSVQVFKNWGLFVGHWRLKLRVGCAKDACSALRRGCQCQ